MAQQFLAYSQITTHRTCPQQWMYRHHRKLEKADPMETKVELEFGNWWHALRAADSIERGLEHGSLRWVPEKLGTVDDHEGIDLRGKAPEEMSTLDALRNLSDRGYLDLIGYVLEEADTWWKGRTGVEIEAWDDRLGEDLPTRLRRVDAAWRERWAEDLPYEKPLAVELYWKRDLPPLTDPETGKSEDTETTMIGYIDEVYLDTRRNVITVRDHKAHKTLAARTSAEDMMDSQLQIYAWGASPTVSSWGLGPIRAVAYDRVRMAAPKSPSVTSTGTLSKGVTDYDLATYLAFAAGPDGKGAPWGKEGDYYVSGKKKGEPKFGRYLAEETVIAKLSDPAALSSWQQRTLSPLNRNVVMAHLRAAVDTSADVRRTRVRAEETQEAGRNLTKGCQWCPFQELCRAEMTGGPGGDYDLESMWIRPKKRSSRVREVADNSGQGDALAPVK